MYQPLASAAGIVVVSVVVETKLVVRVGASFSRKVDAGRRFIPVIVVVVARSAGTAEGDKLVNDGGLMAARSTLFK